MYPEEFVGTSGNESSDSSVRHKKRKRKRSVSLDMRYAMSFYIPSTILCDVAEVLHLLMLYVFLHLQVI